MRTRQGRVFYVAAEDESGMRGRVTALRDRHGDAQRLALVCGVSNLLGKGSADLKAIRQAISHTRPALVIGDQLALALPDRNEKTNAPNGSVQETGRRWSR